MKRQAGLRGRFSLSKIGLYWLRLLTGTFLFFHCVTASATGIAGVISQDDWKAWKPVGQAQLSVFFFDVYTSTLLTPSGQYEISQDLSPHPLALNIEYQRSISQAQLLDATYDQWLKLGYDQAQAKDWINRLGTIFPSVKKGQQLTYVTNGQSGQFYYSVGLPNDRLLGRIDDEQLNDAFLAIWLSPETEYADLRRELIGKK